MKEKNPIWKKIARIFYCLKSAPRYLLSSPCERGQIGCVPKGTSWGTFIFIFLMISQICMAETPPIWKVLLAEASNQGYEGMYAVACVIRNRGGDLHGFYGAKRKDLSVFCDRQGRHIISQARKIEQIVFEQAGVDTTASATHFENIEAFGVPYWAREMIETVKIGDHTFFKERK